MLQDVWHPTSFSVATPVTASAGRPTPGLATVMRLIIEALVEAPAAHHTYEHLKSHGVPYDAALRQALGVAPSGN